MKLFNELLKSKRDIKTYTAEELKKIEKECSEEEAILNELTPLKCSENHLIYKNRLADILDYLSRLEINSETLKKELCINSLIYLEDIEKKELKTEAFYSVKKYLINQLFSKENKSLRECLELYVDELIKQYRCNDKERQDILKPYYEIKVQLIKYYLNE